MPASSFHPGQTVENPVTGERFTFVATAATTGGDLLSFDLALRPGGAVPIPHVHPLQTETFAVMEGLMRFRVGLRTRLAGPGETVEIKPGTIHGFANAGEVEAHVRVEVRPALRMEAMLAEVVAMAAAGRMTGRGLPRNLLDLAALAREFDQEAHAPLLTVATQRLLLAPLVAAARRRGYSGCSTFVAGSPSSAAAIVSTSLSRIQFRLGAEAKPSAPASWSS